MKFGSLLYKSLIDRYNKYQIRSLLWLYLYKAAERKEPKFVKQAIQVKDFMTTKLITFTPNESMHTVIETLVKKGISGAPVVDDHGKLCGVLRRRLSKQVVRGKYLNSPTEVGLVEQFMTKDPIYVSPTDSIMEIAL